MSKRIGYSAETIRIASTLAVNARARAEVTRLIQQMGELTVYSGQRFDQTQQLASLLNAFDTDTYQPDFLAKKIAQVEAEYAR